MFTQLWNTEIRTMVKMVTRRWIVRRLVVRMTD
jgi:hypothetical protein